MKNKKLLIPLLLIVLFLGSVYKIFDNKLSQQRAYNENLNAAREYRQQEIAVDAEACYQEALRVMPSLDLAVEIGEFYEEAGETRKAINWGESLIDDYPKEAAPYDFLIDVYADKKDYVACFELQDTVQKRKLNCKNVEKRMSEIEYEFFYTGSYVDVGQFCGGLCPVQIEDKWGFVNETGKTCVDFMYSKVGAFNGSLAPVVCDNQAYFIDGEGNKKHVVLNVKKAKEVGFVDGDRFTLYNGKTWGVYDLDNEHLFGEYKDATNMGNGFMAVKKGDSWKIIDNKGKEIAKTSYDKVATDDRGFICINERMFVCKGTNYQMINTSGKAVSDQKYEDAKVFSSGDLAAVKLDGKWGFVNADGKLVIKAKYEDARSFANGYAAVKFAGKWGFIDEEGNMVIENQFDGAKDFNSCGGAFILEGDEWQMLRLYKYNH